VTYLERWFENPDGAAEFCDYMNATYPRCFASWDNVSPIVGSGQGFVVRWIGEPARDNIPQ
jgi:hypothetical protein